MAGAARALAFRLASLALLRCSASLACGANTPTIPPELLATGRLRDSPDYPNGPFGTEEGDTLANACFKGFRDPRKVSHDEASLETIAFSDYYDKTGSKGDRLLLINTAAVWCSACRTEHESLSAKNDEYSPRGLRIVSTLFQDAKQDPATTKDLSNWVETFSSDYAMVLDPEYQLGSYATADTAPLNMVIDARTMKIEKSAARRPEPTVLWPFIDASLAQP